MGKKPTSPTVSRLRVALATLISVRECLTDALEFANRGIETARKVIEEQTVTEASAPAVPPVDQPRRSARASDREIMPVIGQWRRNKQTWRWIADELNRMGHRKPRGGLWTAVEIQQFHSRRKATDARTKTKTKTKEKG